MHATCTPQAALRWPFHDQGGKLFPDLRRAIRPKICKKGYRPFHRRPLRPREFRYCQDTLTLRAYHAHYSSQIMCGTLCTTVEERLCCIGRFCSEEKKIKPVCMPTWRCCT